MTLRPEESVVEAFLAIERAPDVASDPVPIVVHAVRVLDRWDGRSLSWATQPRVEDVRLPETRVSPASSARVRLDVREARPALASQRNDPLALAVLADAARLDGHARSRSRPAGAEAPSSNSTSSEAAGDLREDPCRAGRVGSRTC